MKTRVLVLIIPLMLTVAAAQAADRLPSWNDTAPKRAIVSFVEKVTKEGSPDFVPPAERIAVFDNDGTLWSEQPMYFQLAFAIDRVKALAPQHPEWKEKEPFKSVLAGDLKGLAAGGEHALLELVLASHTGNTTEEFEQVVRDWIATAKHAKTGRLYKEMVFQPMLELLEYLRANGFKAYIVSGGGIEFMRAWVEDVYGVPPEQVIGSSVRPALCCATASPCWKLAGNRLYRRQGRQARRHQPIHRSPPAHGLWQLRWRPANAPVDGRRCGPRFCLYVHHTDAEREFAYDRESAFGRLDKGLEEARSKGWTIVDMENDWVEIFPPTP
jgi:hypothetical protein